MDTGLLCSQSVAEFLDQLLTLRKTARQQYSLRAFALALDLSPSMLSAVIKGKRNLSRETATQVAGRLRLTEAEHELFLLLFNLEQVTHPKSQQHIKECLKIFSNRVF